MKTVYGGLVQKFEGQCGPKLQILLKQEGIMTMGVAGNRIWLSSPTMHGGEIKYMTEAYETNWMSTVGENIREIERLTQELVGCKHAVALATGTSALHMAVKLADVKPGEKVFCSDMTFSATANPLLYENAEPVFIDTEKDTWNMDPEALELAFQKHPEVKVVIVVHLYGTPAKMDEIRAVCSKYNAIIIEDAAESLGSTYKGVQTGSLGKYNCISFNGNKIITGSSGGILLTDDKEAAEKVQKWSTQSREDAPWYQHTEIGYNYRMSNVIAGVIRGQYPYLQEHIDRKRAIYERYQEAFKDLPLTMNPYDKENSEPNFWLSCILIDEDALCEQKLSETTVEYVETPGKTCPMEILQKLAEQNIEARPIWKPMHLQPIYRENEFVSGQEGKDTGLGIFQRGLCLPSDVKMTCEEQDRVIEVVRGCFR